MPAHSVPLSCPPRDVGSVGLELTSESADDDDLEEESLDGDDCNHTRQGSGEAEALEEHENNEEDEEDEDSDGVGNGSQNRTELLAAHAEKGSRATSQCKHTSQDTGVDGDGSQSDESNTDQGTGLDRSGKVASLLGGIAPVINTGLGVDEEEGDESNGNQNERTKDLAHEDVGEVSTRNIARELGRWISENLALETSDTCSR